MPTVQPVLKRLHSPDVLHLESFRPADPTCFCLLLQAMFGPDGSDGEESFDVVVCTPRWLESEVERSGMIDGRHHLVVSRFDLTEIRSFLISYARSCEGESWDAAALKLSRLGKWEFEDYRP
jgi:hypothetical protein